MAEIAGATKACRRGVIDALTYDRRSPSCSAATADLGRWDDELALTESDLANEESVLAFETGEMVGVAQVSDGEDGCYLEKLFVDPEHMGKGIGRILFDWSVAAARALGADQMIIEADPGAAPFYRAMACRDAGEAPSGSISGRALPRLIADL